MDTSPPLHIDLNPTPTVGRPAGSHRVVVLVASIVVILLAGMIYTGVKRWTGSSKVASPQSSRQAEPATSNRSAVTQEIDSHLKGPSTTPVLGYKPKNPIPPIGTGGTDNSGAAFGASGMGPGGNLGGANPKEITDEKDPIEEVEEKTRAMSTTVRFTNTSADQAPQQLQDARNALIRVMDHAVDGPRARGNGTPDNTNLVHDAQQIAQSEAREVQENSDLPGDIGIPGVGAVPNYRNGNETRGAEERKREYADGDTSPLHVNREALSIYTVRRGDPIRAILVKSTHSELPGQIEAIVREDVSNTYCGQSAVSDGRQHCYLEIPSGTRLIGEYNTEVSPGQERLQVAWTEMQFPDLSTVNLGKMSGYSADGGAGLKGQVNNHWKRIIGGALLTSTLNIGLAISQNRTTSGSTLSYPSNAQVAVSALGQSGTQLGQQVTQRNLSIPPFITNPVGSLIIVDLNRDLIFDGPYKPLR